MCVKAVELQQTPSPLALRIYCEHREQLPSQLGLFIIWANAVK